MPTRNYSTPSDYQISTPVYEGPLDLLLELIERAELDITTISLAKVTDQFLAYIRTMTSRNADEVSAFLVIAARLVQIKSAALLPRPPALEAEFEEDPGDALVRQLKEYRKYKQIALQLEEREKSGLRTYLRLAAPAFHVSPTVDMNNFDLKDLLEAAQEILKINNGARPLDEVVMLPRVTIREKIELIIQKFQHNQTISFSSLLKNRTKIEVVVTFLAILELIKQNFLEVIQDSVFSDIRLSSKEASIESSDLDTEF
jgi:segregation and condensation protein A